MNCPTDGTVLQLADRLGIEIDYCPTCRGVWLDRGELDKIVERADTGGGRPADDRREASRPPRHDRDRDRYDDDDFDDDRYDRAGHGRGRRKRGGFLGELFDIG